MNNLSSPSKGKAWLEAARPRTLPASLSPVLVGAALAFRDGYFQWVPTLLCVLVALLAQIASNFANDYFDFKKGADGADRLGPERAVAQGWIQPQSMLKGTFITLGLACFCGCMLLFFAGWELIPVGIAIALCVLAYSAGPFPLAYNGLGDVCVLLFYGIIPVCFTYYVQALSFSLLSLLLSIAVGLLSVNILVINNYRDYVQDKAARKRTTIVLFGRRFGRILYLLNGIIALLLVFPFLMQASTWMLAAFGLFFVLFMATWQEMRHKNGKELNQTLAHTARNVLLFSILLSVFLILY
ncbi:MAG: 1,4-dihydroxy-2-naphthoate polyprenyltransferase [Parabacteroides sp.]|nr:1,4-dihydroxy-2-naphthoate polyprenyltransferase [Parabacteroides sp.]MCI7707852.1 1,4-dihydroxy-2-naphthoate polyprenyltransferase [Parabacteroides sp.]MDY5623730.1 1,4-dihydroxy-2-naphthoate polyprenyltransferase [Bacteroidales bacterium]MDY6254492.1 1,4-dihydroxy-2-naphthoate polyprenyltransferase [Bacteroidales bacterium]